MGTWSRQNTCGQVFRRSRSRPDRERKPGSTPCDSSNRWPENPAARRESAMPEKVSTSGDGHRSAASRKETDKAPIENTAPRMPATLHKGKMSRAPQSPAEFRTTRYSPRYCFAPVKQSPQILPPFDQIRAMTEAAL